MSRDGGHEGGHDMRFIMMAVVAVGALSTVTSLASAQDAKTKFWNLTANTINHLYLAPVGSGKYGHDQTPNDNDGTVDHDERLKITDVTSGRYDVKLSDVKGRVCIVKNVDVKAGDIFTIEEKDLKNCKKG
jgi:hypothetical protein